MPGSAAIRTTLYRAWHWGQAKSSGWSGFMFFRVLNNANGKKGPSHSATGMTGAKFAERGHRFADGTLHHSRTNNLAHADLTVSDQFDASPRNVFCPIGVDRAVACSSVSGVGNEAWPKSLVFVWRSLSELGLTDRSWSVLVRPCRTSASKSSRPTARTSYSPALALRDLQGCIRQSNFCLPEGITWKCGRARRSS